MAGHDKPDCFSQEQAESLQEMFWSRWKAVPGDLDDFIFHWDSSETSER